MEDDKVTHTPEISKLDYRAYLKAEELFQLIIEHKARAGRLSIATYNYPSYINGVGVEEETVLDLCLGNLRAAINNLEKAKCLFDSEGCLIAKPYINKRFEAQRRSIPSLRFSPQDHIQDDHDEK